MMNAHVCNDIDDVLLDWIEPRYVYTKYVLGVQCSYKAHLFPSTQPTYI